MKLLQDKSNVNAPDADYPYGYSQDNTGSNNGTPVNTELLGDMMQLMEKMMDYAAVTANGLPDNLTNGFQLFEALQKAARPYKAYAALLSQSGTAAPTIESTNAAGTANQPLENSLSGAIVWAYSSPGTYTGTLAGAFPAAKLACFITSEASTFMNIDRLSDNQVVITTRTAADALANALLNNTPIEIRVYR